MGLSNIIIKCITAQYKWNDSGFQCSSKVFFDFIKLSKKISVKN